MCTIAIATRYLDDAPLAVAANREERYDRPARSPDVLEREPVVFGPTDLEAGGTWIAINESGLLVAVTNRAGGPTGERSRGLLVRDLVRAHGVRDAAALARDATSSTRYDGFNLLVADPDRAIAFAWDGTLEERTLPPGIHVIVNEGCNGAVGKSATVRCRLLAAAPRTIEEWERRARTVVADHGLGACRHGDDGGTRSSSLVGCRADGSIEWSYADGPPCEVSYRSAHSGPLSPDAD